MLEKISGLVIYGEGIGLLLTGFVIFTVSIMVTRYLHKLNLQKSLNAPESTSKPTRQEPSADTRTGENLPSGKENNNNQSLSTELVEQWSRGQRNIERSLQALEERYASLEQLDRHMPVLMELERHLPELQEAVRYLKVTTLARRRDPTITALPAGHIVAMPMGDVFESDVFESWDSPSGHFGIEIAQGHDIGNINKVKDS
jgi:hypothetical protein